MSFGGYHRPNQTSNKKQYPSQGRGNYNEPNPQQSMQYNPYQTQQNTMYGYQPINTSPYTQPNQSMTTYNTAPSSSYDYNIIQQNVTNIQSERQERKRVSEITHNQQMNYNYQNTNVYNNNNNMHSTPPTNIMGIGMSGSNYGPPQNIKSVKNNIYERNDICTKCKLSNKMNSSNCDYCIAKKKK
eukprot:119120_1